MSTSIPPDKREIARRTRRSFLTGGVAALAGFGAYKWIATRPDDGGQPWPLRAALRWNERLSEGYFSPARLALEFPVSGAGMPKVNGTIGIDDDDFDPAKWSLHIEGLARDSKPVVLPLATIHALPKVEFVTELKCIEGWTKRVRWGGAPLREFVAQYQPAHGGPDDYVGFETPDGGYFVGLEMQSALHPQTLLCYEMDGRPLEPDHGAPLRLVTPVKYGIKSLKRIGTMRFTQTRPPDYWAEQGYDYYAGF